MKVELISHTSNPDELCARCAKTCYREDIPEYADTKVLTHATKSGHESVLEHATFTFAISGVSRAMTHQLVRHRAGASYSQESQRYVDMKQADYVIPLSIENNVQCRIEYSKLMGKIWSVYEDLVKLGVPKEDARYVLPNACKSNIIVTMNARELRHFFELRLCNRAQWEIREVAEEMYRLVKEIAPKCFEKCGPKCISEGKCKELAPCGRPRIDLKG